MDTAKKSHAISVCERTATALTGIVSIEGFDESSIVMKTETDGLSLQGRGLHVDKFDSETGDMTVSGQVEAILYYDIKKRGDKKRRGILEK